MGVTVKSRFGTSYRKLLLVVLLLVVVLVVSVSVYVFVIQSNVSSFEGDVTVCNEFELRSAINTAVGPLVIQLDNDIKLSSSLNVTAGKDITLTSNRANGFYKLFGVKYDSTVVVENGGVLVLGGVIVTHVSDVRGSGVYVCPGGTLFMVDGEISGNKANNGYGGGVYNMGRFTMSGGKISDNTAYYTSSFRGMGSYGDGGGVYNGGSFILSGGKISGNTAYRSGGGVYSYEGFFSMSGGVIFNNNANIYRNVNTADPKFNKSGGVIFNDEVIIRTIICIALIIGVIAFLFLFFKKRGASVEKNFVSQFDG
ncbi:MAG: hypothetical protein FWE56_02465 [Candidatus Bathyarchaeota archaeon]|nr:hypothetical protein [Candidatus Termiticorpusculum sp.]MCL2868259.1 hypothetical protein [Candidatus Termiticorpusculum sp.]